MLQSTKSNLIINNAVELGDNISVEDKGKGRHFTSRFIEAGLAHYQEFGDVLITKETLDKFIYSMVGCPVIIRHKDITAKNVDKERVGVVSKVWYNELDGWFWCEGIIWDKQAIDLIKNQGWSVSCTYDFESDFKKGTYHGKEYDMEFTGGEFLHLALVDNPRYERANIVVNSKDTVENEKWITIHPNGEDAKGRPLKLEDGETPQEAIERKKSEWDAQRAEEKNAPKQLGLRGFGKLKKEGEKSNKDAEKRELKEKDAVRKKINDLREAYDILIEEYTPSKDWAKEKEHRDYRADLAKRMFDAEKEAKEKYGLDDDELEDFLEDKKEKDDAESKAQLSESKISKYLNEGWQATKYFNKEDYSRKKMGYKLYKGKINAFGLDEGDIEISEDEFNEFIKKEKEKNKESDYKIFTFKDNSGREYYELKKDGKILVRDYDKFKVQKYITEKMDEQIKDYWKNKDKEPLIQPIRRGEPLQNPPSRQKPQHNPSKKQDDDSDFEKIFRPMIDKPKQKKMASNKGELIMTVLNELTEFIKSVVNNKGDDMKAENEKVDKRDIIRQIMAIAGKEEASEDVKTIAKLAEKLAYDSSEDSKADNKAKNEEDEEKEEKFEEEKEIANKKAKNEEKEEKEAENKCKNEEEEVEEKEEEKAENKCKNSMDEAREIVYGGSKVENMSYIPISKRIELGNNY